MKPTGFFLLSLVFLIGSIYAQDFDNYKPLTSSGKIPLDFTVLSSQAYEEAAGQINNKDKKFDRKAQKKFYLINSFSLHELLYSGKLVYNDVLSRYANKVLDEVLKDDKTLRSQLRLYIVKSPYVNAFATNNGMILINEGLMAQLETEAQLAFVLCHEITHYTNKHVLKQYVQKEKIKAGVDEDRFTKSNDKLFAINNYSKEMEKEADQVGVERYKKTKYALNQLDGVFDVLEYSYLPFDEIVYENSFLEFENFKFPTNYYADSIKRLPISTEDAEDEKHSTHPSIAKRREYVEKSIKGLDNTSRSPFVVSTKEDFLKIRKIARYELVEEYIKSAKYTEALYCIFMLQKEEPNSSYLMLAKAKCIYAIAKFKNKNSYSSICAEYSDVYGASQHLHYLLDKVPSDEFNIYALKFVWSLQQASKDSLIYAMVNDLMRDLVAIHSKELGGFRTQFPEKKTEPVVTQDTISISSSKYDKVKKKVAKENIENAEYYAYAFVTEMQGNSFVDRYEKIAKQVATQKEYEESEAYRKEKRSKKERLRKKGFALGVDKVVLASPFYTNVDERKKEQIRFLDSEEAGRDFLSMVKDNAQLNKVEILTLDDIDLANMNTEKYNDYAYINNWFLQSAKEQKYEVDMLDLNKEETNAFVKKYGTKYVCWMGTLAIKAKKEIGAEVVYLFMVPYLLPWGVAYVATPEYQTYFYTIVYDIEKKESVAVRYEAMNRKDTGGQMNSLIYDTFYQIKQK